MHLPYTVGAAETLQITTLKFRVVAAGPSAPQTNRQAETNFPPDVSAMLEAMFAAPGQW